jgi:hypothetical protein
LTQIGEMLILECNQLGNIDSLKGCGPDIKWSGRRVPDLQIRLLKAICTGLTAATRGPETHPER